MTSGSKQFTQSTRWQSLTRGSTVLIILGLALIVSSGAQTQQIDLAQALPTIAWTGETFAPFRLIARHSGKCLDAVGPAGSNLLPAQNTCSDIDWQRWRLRSVVGGLQIVNSSNPDVCLRLRDVRRESGVRVVSGACSMAGAPGDTWALRPIGDDYAIVAAHTGLCLDVSEYSVDNGAAILQWTCSNGLNQRWAVQPTPVLPPYEARRDSAARPAPAPAVTLDVQARARQRITRPAFTVNVRVPASPAPLHIALSPDARDLLSWIPSDNGLALWRRVLPGRDADTLEASRSVRGEATGFPFWSPDGQSVAYFGNGQLLRIGRTGGTPRPLAAAPAGHGGSWSPAGVIVYAPTGDGPLYSVSASGGPPRPITLLDAARFETGHRHPWFLPDGRHFLFLAVSEQAEYSSLWIGSLDADTRVFLLSTASKATFAAPNHILYLQGTTLMARPFEPRRQVFTGAPVIVARDIPVNARNSAAAFTNSADGTLAYRVSQASRLPANGPVTVVRNWRGEAR